MDYKRILTIQDISCVGQCSMTVAMPILSACGHEVCILPTAMLSTHTGGFGKPAVLHMDEILPQMVKNCLPSVTNEVITLVKDTSLAYAIGTVEIFTRAKQIVTAPNISFHSMLPFLVAGIFYYIFNYLVAFIMERIERSLDYYH